MRAADVFDFDFDTNAPDTVVVTPARPMPSPRRPSAPLRPKPGFRIGAKSWGDDDYDFDFDSGARAPARKPTGRKGRRP